MNIMYAYAHVEAIILTNLDDYPSIRSDALYGSGFSLYSNPMQSFTLLSESFLRKSLVEPIFLSNFAANIGSVAFSCAIGAYCLFPLVAL